MIINVFLKWQRQKMRKKSFLIFFSKQEEIEKENFKRSLQKQNKFTVPSTPFMTPVHENKFVSSGNAEIPLSWDIYLVKNENF